MRLDGALEASELEDLHKEGLALLQRVNQCAASIFIAALPLGLTAREVFLVAYRFRMLQNSRAIEVLMGSRIFDASFTILRVLLEQGFVMQAIERDPKRLDALFDQDNGEAEKALRNLRNRVAESDRAAVVTNAQLDEALQQFRPGSGFVAHDWAAWSEASWAYHTLYRSLSMHSHGSAGAAFEYLSFSDDSGPRLRHQIEKSKTAHILPIAAALTLDALSNKPALAMTDAQIDEAAALEAACREFNTLVDSKSLGWIARPAYAPADVPVEPQAPELHAGL